MKAKLELNLDEVLALIEHHDKRIDQFKKSPLKTVLAFQLINEERKERVAELIRLKDEIWPK